MSVTVPQGPMLGLFVHACACRQWPLDEFGMCATCAQPIVRLQVLPVSGCQTEAQFSDEWHALEMDAWHDHG